MNESVPEDVKKSAMDFLKSNFISVVATVSKENKPEAATVYYWIDNDLNFFFMTHQHSRKFINLQSNNRIAMVVGSVFEPRTVQIEGEAEWLTTYEQMKVFLDQLIHHPNLDKLYHGGFVPKNPFPNIPGIDFAMCKVKIDWLRSMDIDPKTEKIHYHQILPSEK